MQFECQTADCSTDDREEGHHDDAVVLPYERTFILVLRREGRLVRNNPFYLKFWAKLTPLEQIRRF